MIWIDVLIKPKETFERIKSKANWKETALIVVVAAVISQIYPNLLTKNSDLAEIMRTFLGSVLGTVIVYLAMFGAIWVIAKMLGGKGNFKTQVYLAAIGTLPLVIMNAALRIAMGDKNTFLLWTIFLIVVQIFNLWSLIISTISVQVNHGFSFARALAAHTVPVLVLIIIIILNGSN